VGIDAVDSHDDWAVIQGGFRFVGWTVTPQALSLDLRRRVGKAVVNGGAVRAVAARFGVSVSTAVRMGQKTRAGLDLAPRKLGGPGRPILIGAVADWVRERLKSKPDLTMRALAAELDTRGTPASHDTVWRFVRAEGLTVKKRR
jgi:putative transposase